MRLILSEPSNQDCRVLAMSELSAKAIPSSFSLPPDVDAILLEASRVRTLVKSEAVFPQGSEPLGMFRLIQGTLRVSSLGANGRQLFLTQLVSGDWFGEVPLLDGLPRTYDVRATSQARIAVLPASAFWQIIEHRPDVLLAITRLVCGRFRMALEWAGNTILNPLPVRLANRLIALVKRPGIEEAAYLKISQENIAQHLGVSRQSVNRQLKMWEAEGVLVVRYGAVTILDLQKLSNAARGD
ncbi:Crp/Fnr family transcriptional regulator [Pseudomonas syringae]|uniref:Crp/Fnr family transcriptional regulator n=2 Tax=Pseudomonas syringae TaxID=317 RepID=A0A6B2AP65_PSESX|nr:Crp/Fnr family transcriptional regulator [Pseudomonas syringae]NAO41134.1 Crp/Fnr family transcriptional regulator [Pseudomonas syringae]NAO46101.1 Crp/Fnr family transcriptional regulator [Pseudomonas syringae]NAO59732.1 Crp/Fnr family transcriptional regulator [Pseudomonas syringae]NAO64710.1 Crp/Fnr family transcriptional regulator [Pseudomonas syringae]